MSSPLRLFVVGGIYLLNQLLIHVESLGGFLTWSGPRVARKRHDISNVQAILTALELI